jgi:hypothetical protein
VRPCDSAYPPFIDALATLAARIQGGLAHLPRSQWPVGMFLGGAAAVHCLAGARLPLDVDAQFTQSLALPQRLTIAYRDPDGAARYLRFVEHASASLPWMHADARADAKRLKLPGLEQQSLELRIFLPVDLALALLVRFDAADRGDIDALVRAELVNARALRARFAAALPDLRGDAARVHEHLEIACRPAARRG